MTDIALATSAELPSLIDDDADFVAALRDRGADPEPAVWSDESVAWGDYDAVVIRSIWDYYRHPEAFAAWIDRLDAASSAVWNPPATLRWNGHKRYLRDLAERGIPVLETEYVERGTDVALADVFEARGWEKAVVKPAVSAGAFETKRIPKGDVDAEQDWLSDLLARRDVLIQRYAPEITAGELSLIYFDGEYSHAVRKRPGDGDFRVQSEHGGRVAAASPRAGIKAQGRRVVEAVTAELDGERPLYARVDGIERDRTFRLIEVELVEPELFFQADPDAAGRLADALVGRL
ncbi:ATP-grasp domain-containing protein [Halobellus sp. EA9]|uniref:ATP-grasp domain-containing protein n=1 Tax=Halobellus sp. EA9 TaxID=3421647 RepID=UPI003EB9F0F8